MAKQKTMYPRDDEANAKVREAAARELADTQCRAMCPWNLHRCEGDLHHTGDHFIGARFDRYGESWT